MSGRQRAATSLPGLSTAERLVLSHLWATLRARSGARLDLPRVAACTRLTPEVVAAAVEALLARQLLRQHADGRVVVPPGRTP